MENSSEQVREFGEKSTFINQLAKRLAKQKKGGGQVVLIVLGVMYALVAVSVLGNEVYRSQGMPSVIGFGVLYGVIILALLPKLMSNEKKYRAALAEAFYISKCTAESFDEEMKRYKGDEKVKGYLMTDRYIMNFSDTGRESFNVAKLDDIMVAAGTRFYDSAVPGANMQWLDYDGTGSTERQHKGIKEKLYADYSIHFYGFTHKHEPIKGFKNRGFVIEHLKEEAVYGMLKQLHGKCPWILMGGEAMVYASENKKEVMNQVRKSKESYLAG